MEFHDLVRSRAKHLRDGPMRYRMRELWNELSQRLENEPAFREPWMRYREFARMDHLVRIEQDVNVNGSRPFWNAALTAHLLLNFLNCCEQLKGRKRGVNFDDSV